MVATSADPASSLDSQKEGRETTSQPLNRSASGVHFEELFLAKYPSIVSVLFRLLGNLNWAEELANDAFLKLYQQPSVRNNGNPGGWLYRTAMNLGIDALRARARRKHYEMQAGRQAFASGSVPGPLEDLLRSERQERVRAVLANLRPVQTQILVLRHSGFSYKELADILGVARGSVGKMLARAEAEFQERYTKLHGTEEYS